jgi:hypothetical protein
MQRYFEQVMETAGLYNTVGFNDDTRAFPSIPARHDVLAPCRATIGVAGLGRAAQCGSGDAGEDDAGAGNIGWRDAHTDWLKHEAGRLLWHLRKWEPNMKVDRCLGWRFIRTR